MHLRDYQQKVINQAAANIRGGDTSVLIESPTGSGKTIMGIALAAQLNANARIGWVATRRNLLAQAKEAQVMWAPGMKFHPISAFEKSPPLVDILIIDEAHHTATTSISDILIQSEAKIVIGLTATPFRSDGMMLAFKSQVKGCGIHTLIQDGWLSPFDHFTIKDWTPAQVVETYLREQDRFGKSCIFFHTRKECHAAMDLLRAGGVECELVTGESDRETQLRKFETGKVKVLVNMMVLTEGFDAPDLQSIFIRDSGKGPTIQMGGRVLRKVPEIAIKNIVQSVNTRTPFTKVATAKTQYLREDDRWVSITANPNIEKMANAALSNIRRNVLRNIREY